MRFNVSVTAIGLDNEVEQIKGLIPAGESGKEQFALFGADTNRIIEYFGVHFLLYLYHVLHRHHYHSFAEEGVAIEIAVKTQFRVEDVNRALHLDLMVVGTREFAEEKGVFFQGKILCQAFLHFLVFAMQDPFIQLHLHLGF